MSHSSSRDQVTERLEKMNLGGENSSRSRFRSRSRSRDPQSHDGISVYVAGLSPATTQRDLEKLFSECGTVAECHVVADPRSKDSANFGFVRMGSTDDAYRCITDLSGSLLRGRTVTVTLENAQGSRGRIPSPAMHFADPRSEFPAGNKKDRSISSTHNPMFPQHYFPCSPKYCQFSPNPYTSSEWPKNSQEENPYSPCFPDYSPSPPNPYASSENYYSPCLTNYCPSTLDLSASPKHRA